MQKEKKKMLSKLHHIKAISVRTTSQSQPKSHRGEVE